MSRIGGIKYPRWVRDRVKKLWVLMFELLMDELERSGVYDMPKDTLEDKVKRAVAASKAYTRAEKRWREIVAKEPPEVRRAIAETLLPLMSLAYDHE